jgi:hypothetical protein
MAVAWLILLANTACHFAIITWRISGSPLRTTIASCDKMQMVVIIVVRKSVMGLLLKSVTDCAVSKASW